MSHTSRFKSPKATSLMVCSLPSNKRRFMKSWNWPPKPRWYGQAPIDGVNIDVGCCDGNVGAEGGGNVGDYEPVRYVRSYDGDLSIGVKIICIGVVKKDSAISDRVGRKIAAAIGEIAGTTIDTNIAAESNAWKRSDLPAACVIPEWPIETPA